jgi:ParB family chromosome partitioning protein
MIGLREVPVIVRDAQELKKLELAIIENVQRDSLNAIEEAAAYRHLAEQFSLSQEVVAQKVGKSRSAVANKMRLLSLPIEAQKAIRAGKISEGHGRALLPIENSELALFVLRKIIAEDLSVRDTEKIVAEIMKSKNSDKASLEAVDPNIRRLEEELRQMIGCRVSLRSKRKGGTLTINYDSDEDLERLINIFTKS